MPYVPTIVGSLSGGIVYKQAFTVDAAETFSAGALVYFDVTGGELNIKVVPTDGVLVLGMALESAAAAILGGSAVPGKVLVAVFTQDTIIRLKGSSSPTTSHLFVATGYPITATATTGLPTLNVASTSNCLLKVIDLDATTLEFVCVPKGLCVQANLVIS